MVLFLRGTVLILGISGLLVFTSTAIGHVSDASIALVGTHVNAQVKATTAIGKLAVGEFVYILYVEDQTRDLRLTLAGKRCFPKPPDWTKPEAEPVPYYAHFFIERTNSLVEVLMPCHQLKTSLGAQTNPPSDE